VGQKKYFKSLFSFLFLGGNCFGEIIYSSALDIEPATLNLRPAHALRTAQRTVLDEFALPWRIISGLTAPRHHPPRVYICFRTKTAPQVGVGWLLHPPHPPFVKQVLCFGALFLGPFSVCLPGAITPREVRLRHKAKK
jgi:hypothetical protein